MQETPESVEAPRATRGRERAGRGDYPPGQPAREQRK